MIDPLRHMSVFSPDDFGDKPVHVIGVGATGSKIVVELAKLGITNIHVYDFDKIEPHNIANQYFGKQDIGEFKVDALQRIVKELTGTTITVHNERVETSHQFTGIVFLLTDTMSSRKEIWDNCIKYKISVELMIETRMGADTGRVYTINPMDMDQIRMWEGTLVDDEVTEDSLCGASVSVGPTAGIIAGLASWQLMRWFDVQMNSETEDELENEIIIGLRQTFTMSRTATK